MLLLVLFLSLSLAVSLSLLFSLSLCVYVHNVFEESCVFGCCFFLLFFSWKRGERELSDSGKRNEWIGNMIAYRYCSLFAANSTQLNWTELMGTAKRIHEISAVLLPMYYKRIWGVTIARHSNNYKNMWTHCHKLFKWRNFAAQKPSLLQLVW